MRAFVLVTHDKCNEPVKNYLTVHTCNSRNSWSNDLLNIYWWDTI